MPGSRYLPIEIKHAVFGDTHIAVCASCVCKRDRAFRAVGGQRAADPRTEVPKPGASVTQAVEIQIRGFVVSICRFGHVKLQTLLRIRLVDVQSHRACSDRVRYRTGRVGGTE